ncbi:MAG: DUF1800 domain-containing protein [Pseudomonadales bacterium]
MQRAIQAGKPADEDEVQKVRRFFRDEVRPVVTSQLAARMRVSVETDAPFVERLVHFWSNHFAVSMAKQRIISLACVAYENEAIRSQMNGHFVDLLLAAEQHPVMLIYLDNQQSIGPGSLVGRRRRRGLNENLAREILELHTLGVDGGYTQEDVTSFARVITGWTVGNERLGRFAGANPGDFVFVDAMHEPGKHSVLQKSYADHGLAQGEAVLRDLAAHPSTADFISMKLVRHFVADDPPPKAVREVANVFRKTDGDLPSVHAAVAKLDLAWKSDERKFKTPQEYVTSALRGLDLPRVPAKGVLGALMLMNQSPFTAPSPAGWPDYAEHWGSPKALLQRIEWGVQLGERAGGFVQPPRLARDMLDESRSAHVVAAVDRAASASQALGILLASPDFQRR